MDRGAVLSCSLSLPKCGPLHAFMWFNVLYYINFIFIYFTCMSIFPACMYILCLCIIYVSGDCGVQKRSLDSKGLELLMVVNRDMCNGT